jgi:V8-like Glu-specific endopeptidase
VIETGMAGHNSSLAVFIVAIMLLAPAAAWPSPRIWRTSHPVTKDNRIVRDRLHAHDNRNREDYSFLNAVGAVWPADIDKSAAGYLASTGFLIDRCHVLTNLHTVYTDDLVIYPSLGKSVSFAVGQTEGYGNGGALQGLKFLLSGVVIAYGDALIVDRLVHNPENDWALIRLEANVDDSIRPLTVAAVEIARLPKSLRLSIAGFPADLRSMRRDRLDLKDLWESDGEVVRVRWASTAGAVVESTVQAALGSSGSPLYGDFDGQQHVVIGIHQGIRGNGIDVSEDTPNVQILFTTAGLALIRAAQAATPCI